MSGNVYNRTSRYKRQLHGVTLVRKVEKSTERTDAIDAGQSLTGRARERKEIAEMQKGKRSRFCCGRRCGRCDMKRAVQNSDLGELAFT